MITLAVPSSREKLDMHIVNACNHLGVNCERFDIYSSDWIDQILNIKPDGCIYIPEFRYQAWRDLFKERIEFIYNSLNIPIYPELHELSLYESKRKMSYWLKANGISHPCTWVFGGIDEARCFLASATYPIIFKTDFGNASYGVRKVTSEEEAISIINKSFWNGYRVPFYDENSLDVKRRLKAIVRPTYRFLRNIRDIPRDIELDVVLFQECIKISHEWRLIKIGNNYFGHEKVISDRGFHSGSGSTKWTIPPLRVFDFAKFVFEKGQFSSMSLDIFEDEDGALFVNELQAVFGVIANNQMYREDNNKMIGVGFYFDDKAGKWGEREGEFGQDYCYRLRVEDFVSKIIEKTI